MRVLWIAVTQLSSMCVEMLVYCNGEYNANCYGIFDANVNVKYLCIELLNGFMCNIVNANDVM